MDNFITYVTLEAFPGWQEVQVYYTHNAATHFRILSCAALKSHFTPILFSLYFTNAC